MVFGQFCHVFPVDVFSIWGNVDIGCGFLHDLVEGHYFHSQQSIVESLDLRDQRFHVFNVIIPFRVYNIKLFKNCYSQAFKRSRDINPF